jgi:hypothetical protein
MKQQWLILIIGITLISCHSKFKKHDFLIDFQVKYKSPESYYQIKNFEEMDYVDKPQKIITKQVDDTLKISFEIFEGASTEIAGNINMKKDSLILKIGKGIGIKELVTHEYQYKIMNPSKKKYMMKIENHVKIENL